MMSQKEVLINKTRKRVIALNRLLHKPETNYDDFVFFVVPRENVRDGMVRLSINGEPLSSDRLTWVALLIGRVDVYLITMEVCKYMATMAVRLNTDVIQISFRLLSKV